MSDVTSGWWRMEGWLIGKQRHAGSVKVIRTVANISDCKPELVSSVWLQIRVYMIKKLYYYFKTDHKIDGPGEINGLLQKASREWSI